MDHPPAVRTVAPLTRVTGVGVAGLVFVGSAAMGGSVIALVDVPSAVFVLGLSGALLLAVHGPGGVWRACRAALGTPSDEEALRAVGFWLHATALLVASGLIGSLVGFVQILGALDTPSTVGARIAVALISLLYGTAGAVGTGGVAMRLLGGRGAPDQVAGAGAGVLVTLLVGCGAGALLASVTMLGLVLLFFT